MERAELEQKVLGMIEEICGDPSIYDERDLDLFEEDLFDSMAAIEFLVEVEEQLGVVIAPTEVEREEMNTPNKIIERIAERM